jgi:plastocyanin
MRNTLNTSNTSSGRYDMRRRMLLVSGILAAILLAGCGGSSTGPGGGPGRGGNGGVAGAGNGGGSNGGGVDTTTGPAPAAAAVTVGNNFFKSVRNGSANRAVDTVAVGGTVTWTWATTGDVPHSIRSLGSPVFRNSVVKTGTGSTYQFAFRTPGTYQYDCAVHGSAMTGTIVVR